MQNNKIWELIKPIVVLTAIAALMAALLGGTNLLTSERIEKLEKESQLKAVKNVLSADNFIQFQMSFEGKPYQYFKGLDKNNAVVGYAFTLSANGYGGLVKTVVGIDTKGKIAAVEIIDVSNETPGLGQNANRSSFTNQFKDKNSPLTVKKSNPKENEIKAVTGATITSTAVTNTVNLALELFEELKKEGAK
jgi:electron transport complex protein RnfG